MPATLATAHVPFHVDVNLGDPVVPPPDLTDVPRLLGCDPLRVLRYPLEMVIAEKLVTALERGGANTRWRDFADLYLLRSGPPHDPGAAIEALRRVAAHHDVTLGPFEAVRKALEEGHADSKWRAWRSKQGLDSRVPKALADVLAIIQP